MKKVLSVFAALLVSAVILTGCSEPKEDVSLDKENPEATKTTQESSQPDTEKTPKVDYNSADITEWFYAPETEKATLRMLNEIDGVQHGSAGGSLKEARAGADLIQLTKAEDFEEAFAEYMDGMNDLQKDFFSFQIEKAYQSAGNIFADFDNQKLLLSDAGVEDFSIEQYAKEDVDKLYKAIEEKLNKDGVTNQWKNFPELEPFSIK